jgi:hypothetical protein
MASTLASRSVNIGTLARWVGEREVPRHIDDWPETERAIGRFSLASGTDETTRQE